MVRLADGPEAGPDLRAQHKERHRPRGHLCARLEFHLVRGQAQGAVPGVLFGSGRGSHVGLVVLPLESTRLAILDARVFPEGVLSSGNK